MEQSTDESLSELVLSLGHLLKVKDDNIHDLQKQLANNVIDQLNAKYNQISENPPELTLDNSAEHVLETDGDNFEQVLGADYDQEIPVQNNDDNDFPIPENVTISNIKKDINNCSTNTPKVLQELSTLNKMVESLGLHTGECFYYFLPQIFLTFYQAIQEVQVGQLQENKR